MLLPRIRPGGSSTHVQYNDGPRFAGSSAFTFNGSTIQSTAPVLFDGGNNASSIAAPGNIVSFGDISAASSRTQIIVDDGAKTITLDSPYGAVYLGDINATSNSTALTVDVERSRIVVNENFIIDNTRGLVLKDTDGHYWRVQVSTGGTLTTTDLGTSLP